LLDDSPCIWVVKEQYFFKVFFISFAFNKYNDIRKVELT